MLNTNMTGEMIRNRRKSLGLTQADLLGKMALNGRKIGEKTISLWERQNVTSIQLRNYLALCECLEIDPKNQKAIGIFDNVNVINMCSKLVLLSKESQEMFFDLVDDIDETSIKELHSAQSILNSKNKLSVAR